MVSKFFRPISVREDVHDISEEMFRRYLKKDDVVYDIGCGKKPFAGVLSGLVKSHVGVDLADGFYGADKVDLIGTAYSVPAEDGAADAVISSQVIEHLETPLIAISETYRLLKPSGLFFLSFPFLYPIHAEPRDFMRYTEHYVEKEICAEKFEIVELKRVGGFWYLIGLFLGLYLGQFDRGIISKLKIVFVLNVLIAVLLRSLQGIENFILQGFGKNSSVYNSKWTTNYVYVLRKR